MLTRFAISIVRASIKPIEKIPNLPFRIGNALCRSAFRRFGPVRSHPGFACRWVPAQIFHIDPHSKPTVWIGCCKEKEANMIGCASVVDLVSGAVEVRPQMRIRRSLLSPIRIVDFIGQPEDVVIVFVYISAFHDFLGFEVVHCLSEMVFEAPDGCCLSIETSRESSVSESLCS